LVNHQSTTSKKTSSFATREALYENNVLHEIKVIGFKVH
jgi:hypothetical protein